MHTPEHVPIVVDPAMLNDEDIDSDDYEYEYHQTETETFYVNLDLSSYHGPIRPPRRRQESPSTSTLTPASRLPPSSSSAIGGSFGPSDPSGSAPYDNYNGNEVDTHDDDDNNNNNNNDNDKAADASGEPDSVIQILDLHSRNPIVTYQNHVFSCTWADLLGTELFFTYPQTGSEDFSSSFSPRSSSPNSYSQKGCIKSGKDFDLIAANSVKLLGRRANLISNPSTLTPGAGAGTGTENTTTDLHPHQSTSHTNQYRFLQRLVNVKQYKGETDSIRRISHAKRAQNVVGERLQGWARTEEQIAEIQRLRHAAEEGDGDAIGRLEELSVRVGLGGGESAGNSN